ncbi:MAG: hypothetical protein ACE5GJ_13810 [Gemmatimonadota bacterium]
MRIAADGYIDIRDGRRVKTPGYHERTVDPVPEEEAFAYLLSHSFPGHRRVVRALNVAERKRIRLAMWADSVAERMSLVDRIWRAITEQTMPPPNPDKPYLVQVVQHGAWAYPIYLDGPCTRVIPHGGLSVAEADPDLVLHLDLKSA